jgi:hypothetical protein
MMIKYTALQVLFVISGPGGRCMDWHRGLVVPLCAQILVAANVKFGSYIPRSSSLIFYPSFCWG